jgi:hypothetical protein
MVKKKISISKEQKDNLAGFEEILDLVTGEETELVQPRKNQIEDYEVFNYLEKEIQRLEKTDHFIRHQIPILRDTPVIDNVLDNELVFLDKIKQRFISKVSESDSQFFINMDKIFTNIFKA